MNKPRVMASMELSDDDKLDAICPIPMPDRPDYPYGLCFTLTDKEFKKLNLDPSEAMEGGIFHGHFLARIKSVTHTDSNGEKTCRVECQIEDMAIESEDEENEEMETAEEAKSKRRRSVLYATD